MATVPRPSFRSERNVHRDTGYDSDNIDHLTAVELDEEIAKTERRIAALSESCRRETVNSSRDLDDHVTIRRRTAAGGTRLLTTSASDGTGGNRFDRDSVASAWDLSDRHETFDHLWSADRTADDRSREDQLCRRYNSGVYQTPGTTRVSGGDHTVTTVSGVSARPTVAFDSSRNGGGGTHQSGVGELIQRDVVLPSYCDRAVDFDQTADCLAGDRPHGRSSEYFSNSASVTKPKATLPTIKLDHYNGSTDLGTHLAKFENCSDYYGWSRKERLCHLKASIDGPAGQVLWQLTDQSTEADVITLLRNRFGSLGQMERYRAELRTRKRKRGESIQAVYQDIRRVCID